MPPPTVTAFACTCPGLGPLAPPVPEGREVGVSRGAAGPAAGPTPPEEGGGEGLVMGFRAATAADTAATAAATARLAEEDCVRADGRDGDGIGVCDTMPAAEGSRSPA